MRFPTSIPMSWDEGHNGLSMGIPKFRDIGVFDELMRLSLSIYKSYSLKKEVSPVELPSRNSFFSEEHAQATGLICILLSIE